MTTRAISFAIRSHGDREPWVRVVRSEDVAVGSVSIQLTQEGVVVACASTAAVDAEARLSFDGAPVLAITLREGDMEVAIEGSSEIGAGVKSLLAANPSSPIPDAEWDPVEIDSGATVPHAAPFISHMASPDPPKPSTTFDEVGDAPTRIAPESAYSERAQSERPPPERSHSAAAAVHEPTPGRRRMRAGVVRFALLAMLASAFMLWLHVRRLHDVRSAHRTRPLAPSSTAAPPRSALGLRDRPPNPAPVATAAPADLDPGPAEAGRTSPPARPPPSALNVGGSSRRLATPARLAADALANSAYGDAVRLYSALSSEPGANPAYARIVESLRSHRTALP